MKQSKQLNTECYIQNQRFQDRKKQVQTQVLNSIYLAKNIYLSNEKKQTSKICRNISNDSYGIKLQTNKLNFNQIKTKHQINLMKPNIQKQSSLSKKNLKLRSQSSLQNIKFFSDRKSLNNLQQTQTSTLVLKKEQSSILSESDINELMNERKLLIQKIKAQEELINKFKAIFYKFKYQYFNTQDKNKYQQISLNMLNRVFQRKLVIYYKTFFQSIK